MKNVCYLSTLVLKIKVKQKCGRSTKKYGGMKRPFGRPFITPGKGKDLM
jgi:hypothetical protein